MYDAETDTWSVIATNEEMSHLINFSAVNYGNAAIFAFGGINNQDKQESDQVWRLQHKNNTWKWEKFRHSLMTTRSQHTSIIQG